MSFKGEKRASFPYLVSPVQHNNLTYYRKTIRCSGKYFRGQDGRLAITGIDSPTLNLAQRKKKERKTKNKYESYPTTLIEVFKCITSMNEK